LGEGEEKKKSEFLIFLIGGGGGGKERRGENASFRHKVGGGSLSFLEKEEKKKVRDIRHFSRVEREVPGTSGWGGKKKGIHFRKRGILSGNLGGGRGLKKTSQNEGKKKRSICE